MLDRSIFVLHMVWPLAKCDNQNSVLVPCTGYRWHVRQSIGCFFFFFFLSSLLQFLESHCCVRSWVSLCCILSHRFGCSAVPQVRTCGIMWKNARIYEMCHRSGPVELCEKMLEFIKCATGPDLWNYVKTC